MLFLVPPSLHFYSGVLQATVQLQMVEEFAIFSDFFANQTYQQKTSINHETASCGHGTYLERHQKRL